MTSRSAYVPLVLLLSLTFLPTCGGGGGGPPPAAIPLDLGVHSATVPSAVIRTFLNPLDAPATVTSLPGTGPFDFDPADLPGQVAARGPISLTIRIVPSGPGPMRGPLSLTFSGGGEVVQQVFDITATGEPVPFTTAPATPDFGDVLPEATSDLEIMVRNDSLRSPVTFGSGQLDSPAYAVLGSPFPLTLAPNQTRTLTVRFTPGGIANHDTFLRLVPDGAGERLDIRIRGRSTGNGEQVIDLGTQSLTNGETPLLSVEVPDSAMSVTFEGVMTESAEVGLLSLEGPGGKVYENTSSTGAVRWVPSRRAFAVHIPSSDEAATQLVAGGGTYSFRLRRESGSGSTMRVRVLIERRVGSSANAVLPLNIFLAPGLTPDAATALNDANLQSMVTQVDQILSGQGVRLGDISYFDLNDNTFDAIAQGEEGTLFQESGRAQELRLSLFLVGNVWQGQLLGLSGSIDGAKRKGDSVTGVVSLYFDGQPGAIAAVVAHEICHYLGLWHTVDVDGTHDPITDTANCPVTGTSSECSVEGGDLLMHWQGNGGKTLTNGQGLVIRGHAFLEPPSTGGTALRAPAKPWQPDAATIEFLRSLGPGWCGTAHRR
ncbi:MAG: hypothetical protein QNJ98_10870 [Planctomycetota bacterium]|nr:hypothetical protein [Planctomycetota bacterium]